MFMTVFIKCNFFFCNVKLTLFCMQSLQRNELHLMTTVIDFAAVEDYNEQAGIQRYGAMLHLPIVLFQCRSITDSLVMVGVN